MKGERFWAPGRHIGAAEDSAEEEGSDCLEVQGSCLLLSARGCMPGPGALPARSRAQPESPH